MVAYAHMNLPGPLNQIVVDYKKKFNDDMYTGAVYHAFSMLTEAFAKTKSTDPVKVAATLEGMKFKSFNGEVEMRKSDHQLQQGLYITRWEKADAKHPLDAEIAEQWDRTGPYVYTLTIAHAAHMAFGLLSLVIMLGMAIRQRYTATDHVGLWAGTVYWHFLGGLWIYLFLFLRFVH